VASALLLVAVLVLVELSYLWWARRTAVRRAAVRVAAPVIDLERPAIGLEEDDATVVPMRRRRVPVPRYMRRSG
jgi:hypothetical protein